MRGEWESLGDMGWMDTEGYLYLAERTRSPSRRRDGRRGVTIELLGLAGGLARLSSPQSFQTPAQAHTPSPHVGGSRRSGR